MFPFILIAFLVAKIKKLNIKPIFKSYTLYPLFVVEMMYIFFQVNVFMGNYSYIQYSSALQYLYIAVLFIPIIIFKLYPHALVGSGLMLIGTFLNKFVIQMNGGKMPVYATISKLTGYFKPDSLAASGDGVHVLLDSSTRYKILTDYVDVGWSIMSIGDVLIHSFIGVIVFYTIKAVNTKMNQDTVKDEMIFT